MRNCIVMVAGPLTGTPGGTWLPSVILAQLYLIFLVFLVWSARRLPERVATKFGLVGQAKRYMSRMAYLITMGIFGIFFPLFGVIIHYATYKQPAALHVPHSEYWLSPNHLAQTQAFLLQQWLWFACLLAGFDIGLHYILLRANRRQPPRLPWGWLIFCLVYLMGGAICWSIFLTRHFSSVGPAAWLPGIVADV